jgi:hypothetical protein
MLCGRPGTKPEAHAWTNKFNGASSSSAFLNIGGHRYRLGNRASINIYRDPPI